MRRAFLILVLFALLPAGSAFAAASANDVIGDCTLDGKLDKHYTQRELRNALAHIPSDVDEYTNCRDVIRAAQLSGASGGGGGGGGQGGGTSTPGGSSAAPATGTAPGYFGGFSGYAKDPLSNASDAERQAVQDAQSGGGDAQSLDGVTLRPGAVERRNTAIAGTVLPAPLWAVLALGAAGLVLFAAFDLRRRVVARRHP